MATQGSDQTPPRRAQQARTVKRLGTVAGIAVLTLAGLWCALLIVPSKRAYARARVGLIERLAAASNAEQRREAAAPLGTSVEREDGTWVVIAYADSHSMPGDYSCSVARCSDESWFECGEHFCGALSLYARLNEDIRTVSSDAEYAADLRQQRHDRCTDSPVWAGLEGIRTAGSIGAAKECLQTLGFRPIPRP